MVIVFLLLGSNLGDRQAYLQLAVNYIEKEVAPITKKSSIFETQAWGKTDNPDYLNQVVVLETNLPSRTILEKILAIEIVVGRKREEKWGPRVIDIDILFYGCEIINEEGLVIPHPELHKRRFTIEPLAEIAPEFVHPVLNKTIFEIKSELNDKMHVEKL